VSLSENVSRVQLWKDTWRDLKENPMGYGLGKSGWIAHEHLKNSDIKSAYNATDGWYLKTANELGILGILLFLIFFIWAVMRFHQLAFDKDHSILFMIFLLASIINGVSNVLDYFLFNVIFWITIGLMEQLKIDEHAKK
jgi:O-antigen ligase